MKKKVNINRADSKELQKISQIGPVRAGAIIEQRKERPFRDIFELSLIHGLGKKRMLKIIDQGIAVTGYEPKPKFTQNPQ